MLKYTKRILRDLMQVKS